MAAQQVVSKEKANSLTRWREAVLIVALFLLALVPRGLALQQFVTADEAKWVYRSAQFLSALLRGDFAATAVNLTPAVTTTWLGSLGLVGYYQVHQTEIGLPFADWLNTLPQFRADLPVLAAVRWPTVILTSLAVVVIYGLARRLWGSPMALLGAILIALDPHIISLSRIVGHDALVAIFMTLSWLTLLLAVAAPSPRAAFKPGWLIVSGLLAGLAFLSKSPALFLIPFTALLLLVKAVPPGPPKGGESSPSAGNEVPLPDVVAPPSPPEGGENEIPPPGGLGGPPSCLSMSRLWLQRLMLWSLIAYGTFVALWPAAWVAPLRQPFAVVENAFLSAANLDEAAVGDAEEPENDWLVPDLGPFYYLVNGAFKLSPLVTLGLLFGGWLVFREVMVNYYSAAKMKMGGTGGNGGEPEGARPSGSPTDKRGINLSRRVIHLLNYDEFWLGLFALLFLIFMTLGGKRSNRYILPIFPALAFLAAFSWYRISLFKKLKTRPRPISAKPSVSTHYALHTTHHASRITVLIAGTLLVSVLTLLPYAPYYYPYFNPLLGGPLVAPRLVKIGWGEGLDEVGRWLNTQSNPESSRTGSWYASALAPFYRGDIAAVSSDRLDYVVSYMKHTQSGLPEPEIVRYFQALEPLHTTRLAGIEYARVYPGPTAQLVPAETRLASGLIAFRPHTNYAPIGQALILDLIWAADAPVPQAGPTVTLRWHDITLGKAETFSQPFEEALPVRRYRLPVPFDLPPDTIALFADNYLLGHLQAYHVQPPPDFVHSELNFADQVQLVGFAPQVILEGETLTVRLAFKASPKAWADYTIFVHLINNAGERLAGHDAPPTPPTSQWGKDQVVQVNHRLMIPPDLLPGETYRLRVGLYHSQTGEPLGEGVVLPLEVRLP